MRKVSVLKRYKEEANKAAEAIKRLRELREEDARISDNLNEVIKGRTDEINRLNIEINRLLNERDWLRSVITKLAGRS